MTTPTEIATLRPEAFRPDFPILARTIHDDVPLVYLDNAATTQRPRQVIQAIVDAYEQHYANVHRGIHRLAQDSDELYDAAREKVRAFLNAPDVEQIIFTSGDDRRRSTWWREAGATPTCARATKSC